MHLWPSNPLRRGETAGIAIIEGREMIYEQVEP